MQELKVSDKIKQKIDVFVDKLKSLYNSNLVSVIIYGSAASGEFVNKHSNINFLIVLKNNDLFELKKATTLINKFTLFQPLFLSESYIIRSTDSFPIEFLDLKENYILLYGKDILKDLSIEVKNLRFQCEHELKAKLIALRQLYLKSNKDASVLYTTLLKAFTSILHISRNILRLKGKIVPYKKEDVLKELDRALALNINVWQRILSAKNKLIKIPRFEQEELFLEFVGELEKIIETLDQL